MSINLFSPDYKIDINNLLRPHDIVLEMQQHWLKDYCYAFWYGIPNSDKEILMNIGMSEGGEIGDRLYRKVGNLPGWGNLELKGDFGKDMRDVVKRVENKFDIKIDKDYVYVNLWDTSKLVFDSYNSPTVEAEKKLFRDCKDTFGKIPVGNIQDPNDRNKDGVVPSLWNSLFEEVPTDTKSSIISANEDIPKVDISNRLC
jgi:hypothetical protein